MPILQRSPRQILIGLFTAGVGGWEESIRDGSSRSAGRTKFPLILGTDGQSPTETAINSNLFAANPAGGDVKGIGHNEH